jgi:hypothetical protein
MCVGCVCVCKEEGKVKVGYLNLFSLNIGIQRLGNMSIRHFVHLTEMLERCEQTIVRDVKE